MLRSRRVAESGRHATVFSLFLLGEQMADGNVGWWVASGTEKMQNIGRAGRTGIRENGAPKSVAGMVVR